jgi:hypothetical protein
MARDTRPHIPFWRIWGLYDRKYKINPEVVFQIEGELDRPLMAGPSWSGDLKGTPDLLFISNPRFFRKKDSVQLAL